MKLQKQVEYLVLIEQLFTLTILKQKKRLAIEKVAERSKQ